MNLAVKKYADVVSKPAGIPDEWPCEVRELGDSVELPDETWTLMTTAEYAAHLETHRASYEAWKSGVVDTRAQTIAAMEFGREMIISFSTRNAEVGLTEAEVAAVATSLKDVQLLLLAGALRTARYLMTQIIPTSALPRPVIDEYVNRISAFVGD